MTNPQVYKEFQEARNNNINPNEYLEKITNGFNPEMKSRWDEMMRGINRKG